MGLLFRGGERAGGVDADRPHAPCPVGKVEAGGDVQRERRRRGRGDDVGGNVAGGAVGLANGSAAHFDLHVEASGVAREDEGGDFGGVEADVGREARRGGKGAANQGDRAESDIGLRVGEGEGEPVGDRAGNDDLLCAGDVKAGGGDGALDGLRCVVVGDDAGGDRAQCRRAAARGDGNGQGRAARRGGDAEGVFRAGGDEVVRRVGKAGGRGEARQGDLLPIEEAVIGSGEGVGRNGGDGDGTLWELQGEAAKGGRLAKGDPLHLVRPAATGDNFGDGRRDGSRERRPAVLRGGWRDKADGEFYGVRRIINVIIRLAERARRLQEVERNALNVLFKKGIAARR